MLRFSSDAYLFFYVRYLTHTKVECDLTVNRWTYPKSVATCRDNRPISVATPLMEVAVGMNSVRLAGQLVTLFKR